MTTNRHSESLVEEAERRTPLPFEIGGMRYDVWLKALGRSRVTGWRWVKLGMIKPVKIAGKPYITRDEDARFWERARAGEFADLEEDGLV